MLRKPEFDTIYYANLNESPFKYYISILGGGPEFGKTYLYNTCSLPHSWDIADIKFVVGGGWVMCGWWFLVCKVIFVSNPAYVMLGWVEFWLWQNSIILKIIYHVMYAQNLWLSLLKTTFSKLFQAYVFIFFLGGGLALRFGIYEQTKILATYCRHS